MIQETGLACVISGSFDKHKPEIDRTIDEFTDLGIKVLAPTKGWIQRPVYQILSAHSSQFHPLPTERDLTIRQIEDTFLSAITRAHFLYVENPDCYIGNSVSMEIGFALAQGVLVFSREKLTDFIDEPLKQELVIYEGKNPSEVITYLKSEFKL